ncbi:MAG: hypothetical protein WDN66_02775 [Candidatus Saccharibacteria bacterium]
MTYSLASVCSSAALTFGSELIGALAIISAIDSGSLAWVARLLEPLMARASATCFQISFATFSGPSVAKTTDTFFD